MNEEPIKLLYIEDHPVMVRGFRDIFRSSRDDVTMTVCANGVAEAIKNVKPGEFDLIILDLGLPDIGGIEVTRQLREWSQTPIIILSVREAEQDKIAALDAGADDYLTKPFRTGELMARIRSPETPLALPVSA